MSWTLSYNKSMRDGISTTTNFWYPFKESGHMFDFFQTTFRCYKYMRNNSFSVVLITFWRLSFSFSYSSGFDFVIGPNSQVVNSCKNGLGTHVRCICKGVHVSVVIVQVHNQYQHALEAHLCSVRSGSKSPSLQHGPAWKPVTELYHSVIDISSYTYLKNCFMVTTS